MLTREEQLIAQRHVQNIAFGKTGYKYVAWGVARFRRRRYWPAAAVARSRGAKFLVTGSGSIIPTAEENGTARGALIDVALTLGYINTAQYNVACERRPADVRARFAALTRRKRT